MGWVRYSCGGGSCCLCVWRVDSKWAYACNPSKHGPDTTQHNLNRRTPTPKGLLVDDAADAYAQCTTNGGVGVLPPTRLADCKGGAGGGATISEVKLYGDVVLRFVSGDYEVRLGF